jgi:hypothetical protein
MSKNPKFKIEIRFGVDALTEVNCLAISLSNPDATIVVAEWAKQMKERLCFVLCEAQTKAVLG